jgi:hypothetical protein
MKLPKRLNESGVEKRIRSQMWVVEFSVEQKQSCVSFLLVPVAKNTTQNQILFLEAVSTKVDDASAPRVGPSLEKKATLSGANRPKSWAKPPP